MSGTNVVKLTANKKDSKPQIISLTPEMAVDLLEHNQNNRPLSDKHVQRIARQIIGGHWRFNGDTIKIAKTGDVLDGQHRLWAVIEAKKAVDTILVTGIERDAFATIDTVRKTRSAGDTLALCGVERHRQQVGQALMWLLRYQRGCIETWRDPTMKIENSDVEEAWGAHPGMLDAVVKMRQCRKLSSVAPLAFIYYVIANRDEDLAERFLETLIDPSHVSVNDPIFRFRAYLTEFTEKTKDPVYTIALAFKALNAVKSKKRVDRLQWRRQGPKREMFPKLEI